MSTPFIYHPRSAPARGIPPRLVPRSASPGLHVTPEWRVNESFIASRLPGTSRGILCKVRFHLPSPPQRSTDPSRKVLYSRFARALYAPRDPVPYLVYGTYPRTNNAHHLYAFAYRCRSSPRVLAYSANSTDHCRRQVSAPLAFANPVMYYAGHIRSFIIRNEYAPVGATSEMWRTRSIGEGSLCRSVRQINFSLPSAYAGRHEEVALALTCFHWLHRSPIVIIPGRWHRVALIYW